MRELLCFFIAEWKKTKYMSIRGAHLVIPIGVAALFLAYYAFTPWSAYTKLEAYFQVLGMGFPLLIGLFCAIVSEQEQAAGAYQSMLSVTGRPAAFSAKLLLLLLLGTGAVILASAAFGMGAFFLLGQREMDASFYPAAALVLAGSNACLYVLHLYLALRFGKGVTVGLGIVESLCSALLLTGMGEGVWTVIPAAWGTRFVTLLLRKYCMYDQIGTDWRAALLLCIGATAGGLAAFLLWACRWEGRRVSD